MTIEQCDGCPSLKESDSATAHTCTFWHELIRMSGKTCQFVNNPSALAKAIERNKSFKGVW